MGRLVELDGLELLDGDVRRQTGTFKVGRLEFLQGLPVKLRLEIFEDKGKFCQKLVNPPERQQPRIDSRRTCTVPGSTPRWSGAADTRRGTSAANTRDTMEERIFFRKVIAMLSRLDQPARYCLNEEEE
jgi:hypothetical protein